MFECILNTPLMLLSCFRQDSNDDIKNSNSDIKNSNSDIEN